MTNCPKCQRPMVTVMKRESGTVRTYQECEGCDRPKQVAAEDAGGVGQDDQGRATSLPRE